MSERIITIEEQSKRLERRRAELGRAVSVTPNSGVARTLEKRALLQALADEGLGRGEKVMFPASY